MSDTEPERVGTVLLTGASGRMGRTMRGALAERFEQVTLFSRSQIHPLGDRERLVIGDLASPQPIAEACAGADVVIHLGGKADEAGFEEILDANIRGTYHVFEAAKLAGVRRVVYASSHHVTGFQPVDQLTSVTTPVRPDSYYGVSKVFGEALGRLYHDKWGLEVVCLRIGVCREEPENSDQLRTWLSVEDSIGLVVAAATHPLTDGFTTVYGVSNNARRFWDVGTAEEIMFLPRRSADEFTGKFDATAPFSADFQGGAFTAPDYTGGVW